MKLRLVPILGLVLTLASASAQQPGAKPVAEGDLDRIAVEVLKEMHNKGAELYNAGEPSGCLKIYGTALLTVKPFLKHRPSIQKSIDAGIAEVEKADGLKLQAFKMHELIEKIRADLLPGTEKPAVPERPVAPQPSTLSGTLTLDGKPYSGVTVAIAGGKRAFAATTDSEGNFTIADSIPPGAYAVVVTGPVLFPALERKSPRDPGTTFYLETGVVPPAKYQSTETSGLVVSIGPGKNVAAFALLSK